jgi:anaerobic magnesium-protoporphyrin IX monomethyl ester cyclase
MRIGLIFPNKDRRYKTVHLGLGYLVSYARTKHEDLDFLLLDTRVATRKETKTFFATEFDLIAMTVFSPVYFEVIDLFNRIKRTHPDVPVCLGGPYVTTIREEIFEATPADFAVCGEGEITFSDLILYLKGKKQLSEIRGLMYRNNRGEIVQNAAREKILPLDLLPFPAWDVFPMGRYPLHRMVTSRGCPYACAWCNSSSLWGHSFRQRGTANVVEEIESLLEKYGKKIFVFGDNSFNIDLNWVEEFCDLLMAKKIKILWSVSLRADIMTQALAFKMKEAGCYNAAIGIESANDGILGHMGKATDIAKIKSGINMLKKAGIEVLSQFVIGSPHDTLETVTESIEFAKSSGCDYSNFYTVLPFKGTAQWEYVEKHGTFLAGHIHDFHSMVPKIVFETPEFPYKDRVEAIRLAKKEGFYSNKDKKSWLFDVAKETARQIQQILPATTGERIYMALKSVYQLKLVKKNNI